MIERRPLAVQVRDALLERIVCGDLAPGENLVETRLSEELGVSRTPLRSALAGLERDGLVVSRPGHGWSVAPLEPAEAAELYPILHALEDLAMREAGIPDDEALDRLRAINGDLARFEDDPRRAVALNLEWHRTLVTGCDNEPLLDLLEGVRRQVTRYEYAFFRRGGNGVAASREHHERVERALRAGRLDAASAALRDHWLDDLEFMLPGGRNRETPEGEAVPAVPESEEAR